MSTKKKETPKEHNPIQQGQPLIKPLKLTNNKGSTQLTIPKEWLDAHWLTSDPEEAKATGKKLIKELTCVANSDLKLMHPDNVPGLYKRVSGIVAPLPIATNQENGGEK